MTHSAPRNPSLRLGFLGPAPPLQVRARCAHPNLRSSLRRPPARIYRRQQPPRFWIWAWLGVAALLVSACVQRGVTPIRTHFNQGVYHYAQGDYESAIGEYRLAVEEDAGDHRARFNLAEALEARATRIERDGDGERAESLRREAEEHYRALLAADPDHLRANINLAARELQLGDEAAAEARLRTTLERHPRSVQPRVALAAHRFRARDPASIREAVTLLEGAVDLDRSHPDANVLLGHALAALERGDDSENAPDLAGRARQAYERTLERVPGDVGALIGLARLERRTGNADRAEALARRALYILPDLLTGHLMLADLLEARGELEEATVHLWRARQLEATAWENQLSPDDYRRRLLDLYRRLVEQEGAVPPSP